jgi:hypothetical protein
MYFCHTSWWQESRETFLHLNCVWSIPTSLASLYSSEGSCCGLCLSRKYLNLWTIITFIHSGREKAFRDFEKVSHITEKVSSTTEKVSYTTEKVSYTAEKVSYTTKNVSYTAEKSQLHGACLLRAKSRTTFFPSTAPHTHFENSEFRVRYDDAMGIPVVRRWATVMPQRWTHTIIGGFQPSEL